MVECPGLLNLATISGYYAQLTGILAGFAFTALVVLLSPTQVDERKSNRSRDNGVVPSLFAAFIALVLSSLMYSVLAGDNTTEAHGRAATLELIDGLPFGLAAIMLFQGITLLLEAGDIDRVAVWTGRVVTVVVAPTITMYYITTGASDSETARAAQAGSCDVAAAPGIGVVLTLALVAILSISIVPRLQPRTLRSWARKVQAGTPVAVLALSITAAIIGGALSTRSPDYVLPPLGVSLYLVLTFALLALLGLSLALGYDRPSEQHLPEVRRGADDTYVAAGELGT